MVLDAFLLNTLHYKVQIKSKVEKFREIQKFSAPLLHFGIIANTKGSFEFSSTTVTTFTYIELKMFFSVVYWILPSIVDAISK